MRNKLLKVRKETLKITQAQLARDMNVSRQSVLYWEKNETLFSRGDELIKIAKKKYNVVLTLDDIYCQ